MGRSSLVASLLLEDAVDGILLFISVIASALALPLSPAYAVLDVSPSARLSDTSTYVLPDQRYVLLVSSAIYSLPDSPVTGNAESDAYYIRTYQMFPPVFGGAYDVIIQSDGIVLAIWGEK